MLVHPVHDDRYRLIKVNTFWSERFESRRLLLHQLKVRQRLTVASSCAKCTPLVSSQPASNQVREKIEEIGEQVSQSEFTSGGSKSFRILKGSKFSFREAAEGLPLAIHFSLSRGSQYQQLSMGECEERRSNSWMHSSVAWHGAEDSRG